MITTSEKNFITRTISLAFKYFVNITLNIRHIPYQKQASVYTVGEFHYYGNSTMYCAAGWESQTEWLQLSDQQPEQTTAGLIRFRRGHVVGFSNIKTPQSHKTAMVVLPEKGQAERCSSFPRCTTQGCQNMPTRITVWEITHKKESTSENKLDISIILLLASCQQPYWRARSDIYVQLVYQLTTAKLILSDSGHIYVSTGYTPNVKGSNYFSTTLGKICHDFCTKRLPSQANNNLACFWSVWKLFQTAKNYNHSS